MLWALPLVFQNSLLLVAMSDVQNFFLEAIAVIFVKVQYLYILQKKAIGELYLVVPVSSCAFNVCGSCAHFTHTKKCKLAPLILHRFVRHKYLREDHSLAKIVV